MYEAVMMDSCIFASLHISCCIHLAAFSLKAPCLFTLSVIIKVSGELKQFTLGLFKYLFPTIYLHIHMSNNTSIQRVLTQLLHIVLN